MALIIINIQQQINKLGLMTTSYELRNRSKYLTPRLKKYQLQGQDEPQKSSPKTAHQSTHKTISQNIHYSNSTNFSFTKIANNTDPFINENINNEISNAQINSNSQFQSMTILRKNKLDDIENEKQEDVIDSIALEDSILSKHLSSDKTLKKHQSSIQGTLDRKESKEGKESKNFRMAGIPFRKFQTQLEQKIVGFINKVKQGKLCEKDVEKFISKIVNAPNKDLKNKYFISGISTVIKLLQKEYQNSQPGLEKVQRMKDILKKMLCKIENLLDNTDDFTQISQLCDQEVNVKIEKLISRVFKILRKKKRAENRCILQGLAIDLVKQHSKASLRDQKGIEEQVGERGIIQDGQRNQWQELGERKMRKINIRELFEGLGCIPES